MVWFLFGKHIIQLSLGRVYIPDNISKLFYDIKWTYYFL